MKNRFLLLSFVISFLACQKNNDTITTEIEDITPTLMLNSNGLSDEHAPIIGECVTDEGLRKIGISNTPVYLNSEIDYDLLEPGDFIFEVVIFNGEESYSFGFKEDNDFFLYGFDFVGFPSIELIYDDEYISGNAKGQLISFDNSENYNFNIEFAGHIEQLDNYCN